MRNRDNAAYLLCFIQPYAQSPGLQAHRIERGSRPVAVQLPQALISASCLCLYHCRQTITERRLCSAADFRFKMTSFERQAEYLGHGYAGTTTTRHQLTCGEDPPHVVIREWRYGPRWLRVDDDDDDATFTQIFNGLCFDRSYMCVQCTKFEVQNSTRSWDNRGGYPKYLDSPWIRPRSLFSEILMRFVRMTPVNASTKFEVRSLTWDDSNWSISSWSSVWGLRT